MIITPSRTKRLSIVLLTLVSAASITGASSYTVTASPQSTLGDAKSQYAKLDGHRVHYKSHGKGREALVFVHGWTCNLGFWKPQVTAFEGKTRIIALDLPGHGESDRPQIAYTMDLFARAVDAVLQDAGVDRAVLVGHSMGTPVINEFYRKYPKKTLALVIVDGPLRPFADKAMMEGLLAQLRGADYKARTADFVEGMMGPQTPAALREEIKASMLRTPQHVAISAMEAMADESIWKLDKINVPVLAVLAKGPFWPADNEQYFRSLVANLDYQMWDGVSHFLMMEKPKGFNDALMAFLSRNKLIRPGRVSLGSPVVGTSVQLSAHEVFVKPKQSQGRTHDL